MSLTARDFPSFFRAIHDHDPFPWQQMLVEYVLGRGGWPRGIDLPTAAGKTATLDIAVFTLAASVDGDAGPALPRRVFFVVDRRIIVDAAYERAQKIQAALEGPCDPVVAEVARRLARLGSGDRPLFVARARGGILTDDQWVRDPSQVTIVTGTVDQIGSRMLFRGYGPGQRSQSIHAAMIATDSLILLDEAHCARPFMQTAGWIQHYAGPDWCAEPVARRAEFVVLSATLPEDVEADQRFPANRAAALDHPVLQQRLRVSKPADLITAAKAPPKPKRGERGLGALVPEAQQDKLVQHASDLAIRYVATGEHKRIAVMVNRVATAAAIHAQLVAEQQREDDPLDADVVLMTGRMRPIDRDALMEQWEGYLKADARAQPERPIIVVTTQCLEVGADWDFDALITECASLDALRQRFGRLNRLGGWRQTQAAIVHRKARGGKRRDDDPIYGTAIDATWDWLHDHAQDGVVDFGIAAVEDMLASGTGTLRDLMAPSPDAPILLPAHLDLLCQTSPRPVPDPDVAVFLHGPQRGRPEARVVFRCDLSDGSVPDSALFDQWQAAVALLPPCSAEMLAVPLVRLRAWLEGDDLRRRALHDGDVESQGDDEEAPSGERGRRTPFLLWRGRNDSKLSRDPGEIRPNDIVIVPAREEDAERLGALFCRPVGAGSRLDVAEQACLSARGEAVLRVTRAALGPWQDVEPVAELLAWAETDPEERERDGWVTHMEAIAQSDDERLADWLRQVSRRLVEAYHKAGVRIEEHPVVGPAAGGTSDGVVLVGRRGAAAAEEGEFADEDDTRSEAAGDVTLKQHTADVVRHARMFAERALREGRLRDAVLLAARLHDLGKADERFQAYLRLCSGDGAGDGDELLAKSRRIARSRRMDRWLRRLAGLPDGFRHEMLSMQLAERSGLLPDGSLERDLVLHLIASHHGRGRPFAPYCKDSKPPDVRVCVDGEVLEVAGDARVARPAHRLDSGVAERFWRLTRHFGWWGLAYLESVLRLADWRASAHPSQGGAQPGAQEAA